MRLFSFYQAAEKQRQLKECQLRSEEIPQIRHVQLPTSSPSLPPVLVTKSGNHHTTALANPYSLPPPKSTSSQLNGPQTGDAVDDARYYWASRGFHFPPVVSTSNPVSSTQAIVPLPNTSR